MERRTPFTNSSTLWGVLEMTVRANRRPKELLPENRRKLGQKAKLLLQRANLDADPNYL